MGGKKFIDLLSGDEVPLKDSSLTIPGQSVRILKPI